MSCKFPAIYHACFITFVLFAMLASFYIPVDNYIVSNCFSSFPFADMASNIPSFVKRSTRYEDLFGEASGSQAPVPATPVSQLPTPSLEQKKASSGGR